MATEVPPQSYESEEAIVGEVLNNAHRYEEVAWLRGEHFFNIEPRTVFEAIADLRENGRDVDVVSVFTWLRDRDKHKIVTSDYLANLAYKPARLYLQEYALTVHDKWRARELINHCRKTVADALTGSTPTQALLHLVEQQVADLSALNTEKGLQPVYEVMLGTLQDLGAARERGGVLAGTSTGFGDLDKRTAGYFAGDLYILAARPGMGKTAAATSMALNIARPRLDEQGGILEYGDAVAFFTLEMPRNQMAIRFACSEGKIDASHVRANKMGHDEWEAITNVTGELSRYPIWIDDTPAITLGDIRTRVRKLKREIESGRAKVKSRGLKLVVVDYMQLMHGEQAKNQTREQVVSSFSQGLKKLAKTESVAVLALSQLNRGVEKQKGDKRPGLADLRESGSIEQDADTVWFLYRPAYYDRGEDERDTEIITAKQRNGPTGIDRLIYEGKFMRFFSAAAEYDDLFIPDNVDDGMPGM